MKASTLAVLLMLGIIWGASFVFIKLGLESYAPATIVALRLSGAAVVLSLVLRRQGHRLPTAWRPWRDMVLVGLIGMVIPFALIAWGEQYINSGLAAILIATTPLFTLLLAFLWTHEERLGILRTLGVLLGFLGVAVAVEIQQIDPFSASVQGQAAVLLAASCYAFVAIYSRRAFRGMHPMIPATGTMIGGALCIVPAALLLDGLPTSTPAGAALAGVLGLTLLSTAAAYILYYWLLERLGSSRTAMVTYLVPIFALLLGWLWLHEEIGPHTLLGLSLVLAGILIANSAPARQQPTAASPNRS